MSTVSDEDLTRLLDEVASSYDVPEHGPDEVLAAIADVPPAVPLVRRRWVQLSAAAAVVTVGALVAASVYGGSNNANSTLPTAAETHGVAGLNGAQAPSAGADARQLTDSLQPQKSFSTGAGSAASGGAAQAPASAGAAVRDSSGLQTPQAS